MVAASQARGVALTRLPVGRRIEKHGAYRPRFPDCYASNAMFGSSTSPKIEFLPTDDACHWVADRFRALLPRLGADANNTSLFTQSKPPRDFDDLFELMCDVQGQVGQGDVEFGLVNAEDMGDIPAGFTPLGNGAGQLMHTFRRGSEFVTVVAPLIFRKSELVFASVARELGRIAIARVGGHQVEAADYDSDAELAAIALGMGVWVANGSYIYQNACCGGGCGINLKSLRAGLSMPEACFAAALDGQRKGISRRSLAKHLESNQKAAFKTSWAHVGKAPELKSLAEPAAVGVLVG